MRNQIQKMKSSGFTLIELVVVITIIATLAATVVVALNSVRGRARDTRRLADMRQIQTAMELFYQDLGAYPTTTPAAGAAPAYAVPAYVGKWPVAPTPNDGTCTPAQNTYTYTVSSTPSDYWITFCLGASTGGFPAGARTLTGVGGIQ